MLFRSEEDGTLTVKIVVPFNSDAIAYLPDADLMTVKGLEGIKAEQEQGKVKAELTAGSYVFSYTPTKNYEMRYSIDTPVKQLIAIPETNEILAEFLPQLLQIASGEMGMELPYSIGEAFKNADSFMLMMLFGGADQNTMNALNEKLKTVHVKIRTV